MKIPRLFQKTKKLQAATRTLPRRAAEEYEEPNMRLSSALIVVVLLHIVAVGGIYAFSTIKTRQGAREADAIRTQPAVSASAQPAGTQTGAEAPRETAAARTQEAPAKPAIKDSGQIYTVVKGDKPVVIARKLGVSYDEMLRLNKIEDPRKLQIGQKLRLPPKIKSS